MVTSSAATTPPSTAGCRSTTAPGDLLAFYDAGAYTLELMTPYNARPTAAAYAVTEGSGLLRIRAAQSRDDLVALDEATPLPG